MPNWGAQSVINSDAGTTASGPHRRASCSLKWAICSETTPRGGITKLKLRERRCKLRVKQSIGPGNSGDPGNSAHALYPNVMMSEFGDIRGGGRQRNLSASEVWGGKARALQFTPRVGPCVSDSGHIRRTALSKFGNTCGERASAGRWAVAGAPLNAAGGRRTTRNATARYSREIAIISQNYKDFRPAPCHSPSPAREIFAHYGVSERVDGR